MHNLTAANALVNADPSTTCPRCHGTGSVKFTRRGGWIIESCSVCNGRGVVDPATADTVRKLMEADDISGAEFPPDPEDRATVEALGPAEGPCCDPAEGGEPCLGCAPFEPSPEDEADYLAWCREREERLLAERMEAGPSFVEKLTALAYKYLDDADDDMVLVGEWLWEKKEHVEFFGARDAAQYRDRHDAYLDAELARIEAARS